MIASLRNVYEIEVSLFGISRVDQDVVTRKHPDVPSLRLQINDGTDQAARPGARGQRSQGHHHIRFSL